MNNLVRKISTLGILGLVLLVAIEMNGIYGGVAIMVALSPLGPGGMIKGFITIGLILLIFQGITEYGFENIVKGVLFDLYLKGESAESLKDKIKKMMIPHSLKLRLYELVDKFPKRQVSYDKGGR